MVLKDVTRAQAARVVDSLELFGIGFSFGGYESLAVPYGPAPTRSIRRDHGGAIVRLQIGLEDPGDLIADLAQALAALTS